MYRDGYLGRARFEMARAMTNGGPAGSTSTLSYFIFTEGFETGRLGYASAVAWGGSTRTTAGGQAASRSVSRHSRSVEFQVAKTS